MFTSRNRWRRRALASVVSNIIILVLGVLLCVVAYAVAQSMNARPPVVSFEESQVRVDSLRGAGLVFLNIYVPGSEAVSLTSVVIDAKDHSQLSVFFNVLPNSQAKLVTERGTVFGNISGTVRVSTAKSGSDTFLNIPSGGRASVLLHVPSSMNMNGWFDVGAVYPVYAYLQKGVQVPFSIRCTSLESTLITTTSTQPSLPSKYSITLNTNPPGLDGPQGGGTYDAGVTITISVGSVIGYTFVKWQKNGADYSTQLSFSYTVDASHTFTAVFELEQGISVTVNSDPAGEGLIVVDSVGITTPHVFTWPAGSTHTLSALSPGVCYGGEYKCVWTSWSDGGQQSHSIIVPQSDTAYTASYVIGQYRLVISTNFSDKGTTDPPPGEYWYNATGITVTAVVFPGNAFQHWNLDGANVGDENPIIVLMNGPHQLIAHFDAKCVAVTVDAVVTGAVGTVLQIDGGSYTSAQLPAVFSWPEHSTHTISAVSPVSCGLGCQYVWNRWDDGGAQSHQVSVHGNELSFTAYYDEQFYLTMNVSPDSDAGTVTPSSG